MNADLQARLDATLADTVIEQLGVPAVLVPGGAGEPLPLPGVSLRELPASRVQFQYGLDDVRMADAVLLRAQLGTVAPAKDDILDLAGGPQAGAWRILGLESQDAVAVVVRLRRSSRASSTAPGVTIQRR
jgi:hypothetical protein